MSDISNDEKTGKTVVICGGPKRLQQLTRNVSKINKL